MQPSGMGPMRPQAGMAGAFAMRPPAAGMAGGVPMVAPTSMTAGGSNGSADKLKQLQVAQAKRKGKTDKNEKAATIFAGGLRKSTSEDKVAAHFAKYGQVTNVDIKRLPDGTSRGFAFVQFEEVEAIEKVMEAKANHMIDNKWVAVRPHGGDSFNAAQNAEAVKAKAAAAAAKEEQLRPEAGGAEYEDFEEKWSEKYLEAAAKVGATQQDEPSESASSTQSANPMGAAMGMAAMPNMAQGMMPMMMGGGMCGGMGGAMGGMGGMPGMGGMGCGMGMMNPMMMNPMMMNMMMNPMMMGMMMNQMSEAKPEGSDQPSSGPAPREDRGSDRSRPY